MRKLRTEVVVDDAEDTADVDVVEAARGRDRGMQKLILMKICSALRSAEDGFADEAGDGPDRQAKHMSS